MEKIKKYFNEITSSQWNKNTDYNLLFLRAQELYFNDLLKARGHVLLNDVYDGLGFDRTSKGCITGWLVKPNGCNISFNAEVKGDTIILEFNVDGIIYEKI